MKRLLPILGMLLFCVSGFSFSENESAMCATPTGLAVTANNGNNVTLTWNAMPSASRYEVEVEAGQGNFTVFEWKNEWVFGNSVTVWGLTPGLNYRFNVESICGAEESFDSPDFHFTAGGSTTTTTGTNNGNTNTNNPGGCIPPTGLRVSVDNGNNVTLAWDAVADATHYQLDVDEADNANFDFEWKNDWVSTNSMTVWGLVPGQRYEFDVESVCTGFIESIDSPKFRFTAGAGATNVSNPGNNNGNTTNPTGCGTPTGLGISDDAGSYVTLTWNAVPGAIRYEVDVDEGNNSSFDFEWKNDFVTGTSVTVWGLIPGQNYKFDVESVCGNGFESIDSPEFHFTAGTGATTTSNPNNNGNNNGNTTNPTVCAAPTGLHVSADNGNNVTLSWGAVAGAIRYEVDVDDGNNTNFDFEWKNDFVTGTSVTVWGLTPGQNYKFDVQTVCGNGFESLDSPEFHFTTGTGATTTSNPNNNGNNNNGNTTNPTAGCTAPTGLRISADNGNNVTLTWDEVPGAMRYEVDVDEGDNNPNVFEWRNDWVFNNSVTVWGLTPGQTYEFDVQTVCLNGFESLDSPEFRFTAGAGATNVSNPNNNGNNNGNTTNPTVCAAPSGLGVAADNGNFVTLTWDAMPGALRYEVDVDEGFNNPNVFDFNNDFVNGNSITVFGLVPGQNYVFNVQTVCANGFESIDSPLFQFTAGAGTTTTTNETGNETGGTNTNPTGCTAPTGLSVYNITNTTGTLSWSKNPNDFYQFVIENQDGTEFLRSGAGQADYAVTWFQPGNYRFKVKVFCADGNSSDYSAYYPFTIGDGNGTTFGCGIPSGLAVSNITNNSAMLTWDAMGLADFYRVSVEDRLTNGTVFDRDINVFGTSHQMTGLQPGQNYQFKVRSTCGGNNGDDSQFFFFNTTNTGGTTTTNPTTGTGACTAPRGLNVTNAFDRSVTLTWEAVPGAWWYELELEDDLNNPVDYDLRSSSSTNSYSMNWLPVGGTYKFKVKAHCQGGATLFSPFFSFNTLIAPRMGNNNPPTGVLWVVQQPDNTVDINLADITAEDLDAYQIEKSTDGFEFSTIETFSAGNPGFNNLKTTDESPTEGLNQYRARLDYAGGSYSYTEIKMIDLRYVADFELFPNPTTDFVNINLDALKDVNEVEISVTDVMGREVMRQRPGMVTQSIYTVDVSDLNAGMYQIRLLIDGRRDISKQLVINRL